MKKQKNDFKDFKLKDLTKGIILKSKERNLVKSISEAFKDIPAEDEIHKGKKEYFS